MHAFKKPTEFRKTQMCENHTYKVQCYPIKISSNIKMNVNAIRISLLTSYPTREFMNCNGI